MHQGGLNKQEILLQVGVAGYAAIIACMNWRSWARLSMQDFAEGKRTISLHRFCCKFCFEVLSFRIGLFTVFASKSSYFGTGLLNQECGVEEH